MRVKPKTLHANFFKILASTKQFFDKWESLIRKDYVKLLDKVQPHVFSLLKNHTRFNYRKHDINKIICVCIINKRTPKTKLFYMTAALYNIFDNAITYMFLQPLLNSLFKLIDIHLTTTFKKGYVFLCKLFYEGFFNHTVITNTVQTKQIFRKAKVNLYSKNWKLLAKQKIICSSLFHYNWCK